MPRALKTYTTSAGFFDLAIAVPSMKAALEAWGARSNLFSQGFAKVTDDPEIVRATLAKLGVVLRRAVGSTGRFSENAALPKELPVPTAGRKRLAATSTRPPSPAPDPGHARAAVQPALPSRAAKQAQRDTARGERNAAREEAREKRMRAIAAAEQALASARRDHAARIAEFDAAQAALDRRRVTEDADWERNHGALKEALRRARSVRN